MPLSESQLRILEALGTFKYLTVSRIINLGILKHKSSISVALSSLKSGKNAYIEEISFGLVAGLGKLETVYYLSKSGADFLVNELNYNRSDIRYPVGNMMFKRDYFHRLTVIDFQIGFYKWILQKEYDKIKFCTYFDKLKHKGEKDKFEILTYLDLGNGDYIIPDADTLFKLDNKDYLINVEVINGHDVTKNFKQLQKYIYALSKGTPSIKYGIKRGSFVACIFEKESCMRSIMKNFSEDNRFYNFKDNFIFKTIESMNNDFVNNWFRFSGEIISFDNL